METVPEVASRTVDFTSLISHHFRLWYEPAAWAEFYARLTDGEDGWIRYADVGAFEMEFSP